GARLRYRRRASVDIRAAGRDCFTTTAAAAAQRRGGDSTAGAPPLDRAQVIGQVALGADAEWGRPHSPGGDRARPPAADCETLLAGWQKRLVHGRIASRPYRRE